MMSSLDSKYDIEMEITSRPREEYQTDEYSKLGLPGAPAIIVGEEMITEGKDVDDLTVEGAICRQLGLPEPKVEKAKGGISKLFGR